MWAPCRFFARCSIRSRATPRAFTHFCYAVAQNLVKTNTEPKNAKKHWEKQTNPPQKKQCFRDSWVSWGPQLTQESVKHCLFGVFLVCLHFCGSISFLTRCLATAHQKCVKTLGVEHFSIQLCKTLCFHALFHPQSCKTAYVYDILQTHKCKTLCFNDMLIRIRAKPNILLHFATSQMQSHTFLRIRWCAVVQNLMILRFSRCAVVQNLMSLRIFWCAVVRNLVFSCKNVPPQLAQESLKHLPFIWKNAVFCVNKCTF